MLRYYNNTAVLAEYEDTYLKPDSLMSEEAEDILCEIEERSKEIKRLENIKEDLEACAEEPGANIKDLYSKIEKYNSDIADIEFEIEELKEKFNDELNESECYFY